MKNQTLQYYMHDGPSAFRFELAGDLNSEGARELHQAWRTASSIIGNRTLIVDMTFVTGAGPDGRSLLAGWYADGAQIVAKSKASRELAEAIVGGPLPDLASAGGVGAKWTWLPFYAPSTLLLLAMLLPAQAHAANLKAETVAAWDDYVQSVSATLQDCVRPGSRFLWTYEKPERIARVHNGEIVVAPAPGPSPRKVPGGLIHHWIGAAFVPGAKLDDIVEVTRNYDHYKEFYSPSVVESKATGRNGSDDRFSMLLMNRAFFLKTTLDADYLVTNVRLDDHRFYTVAKTTRVQEIEDYGQPSERRFPTGEGGGYIWRLFSIARLEQSGDPSNAGVYVEMETVALSREIPGAMRLVVDPIVRHVSRNSLLTSIRQTEEAVRWNSLAGVKAASSPAGAGHVDTTPRALPSTTSSFVPLRAKP